MKHSLNGPMARLLLIVVAALMPALMFQLYSDHRKQAASEQLINQEVRRLAGIVMADQERILEGAEQSLGMIIGAQVLRDGMPDRCQQRLKDLLKNFPRYQVAAVTDPDGHVTCSTRSNHRADVSHQDYFRYAIRTDDIAVGTSTAGDDGIGGVLSLARRYYTVDGTVGGVVVLGLRLDWLGRQLGDVPLPANASAFIADSNGVVLAHFPDQAQFAGVPLKSGARLPQAASGIGLAGSATTNADTAFSVMAFAPMAAQPAGLRVGVSLDPAITSAAMADLYRSDLLLILAGVILALLIAAALGDRQFRRPLDQLLRAAEQWRSGDLAARTGLPDDGGFGRLAKSFDRMAESLAAREHAFHTALESTTDGVMVLDRDWRLTFLNQQAKKQLATDRDLIGRRVWDVLPDVAEGPFHRAYQQAFEHGTPTFVDAHVAALKADFVAHAYPSADHLTVFFRDVTEERRIACALVKSECLFSAAFEQAAVGMVLLGVDERILLVNDKLCSITGYDRAELLKLKSDDITHPDDRMADSAAQQTIMSGSATSGNVSKRYIRKDGAVVWINLVTFVLRDANGIPEHFFGVVEDITEKKRVAAALRESEASMRLAREAAGFGTWDWDILGDSVIWSDENWRLHGIEPRSSGQDYEGWLNALHPEDRCRVSAEMRAACGDQGIQFDTMHRVVHPDGTVRWLLAKGTVLRDTGGQAIRMVGINMDITESHETEVALRRRTIELEVRVRHEIAAREAAQTRVAEAERMQALGRLAGGIAHDVNNLLQVIDGATKIIIGQPDDAGSVLQMARLTNEAVERGTSVTSRLLAFGRFGARNVDTVDVGQMLHDLHEILSRTLGASISVKLGVEAGLTPIMADRRQLEMVLLNLAANGRDAMAAGGCLILTAASELVSGSTPHKAGLAPGGYARLTVTDTGAGMDGYTLTRAAEPFFTTKEPGSGTGLGLSMAMGFAEQSGGALRIESKLGCGSTVSLWLPLADIQSEAPATPAVVAPPPRTVAVEQGVKVLLVDDERMVRLVLSKQLRNAGYQVVTATDGEEALRLVQSGEQVDVLVTDLAMQTMDGLALIQLLQERNPGLPAVLLTGYAGDDAALALSSPMPETFSLLRKPIRVDQLHECIQSVLKQPEEVD